MLLLCYYFRILEMVTYLCMEYLALESVTETKFVKSTARAVKEMVWPDRPLWL